ncbi:MAG: hypothetical protein NZ481_02915 [Candidatus Kapabacteria bacterium]|nr:hypothetical protein [Candidatus Kapabacteria bacterium]
MVWWMLFTGQLSAQAIRLSGSVGTTAELYRAYGNPARLPSETYRAVARLNVSLFNQIELPLELFLNSGQVGFQQPFNQVGITPRVGDWLQLFGGWYSTSVSDLTFGDLRILGGGVELMPGNFRLAVHYGYTRLGREPDPSIGFFGEYRRRVILGKLGFETPEGTFITLQAMTSQDEAGTIRRDSLTASPQANAVLSVAGGASIANGAVRIRGELAAGLLTNNLQAGIDSALAENIPALLQQIIPINATSNIDGAARLNIAIAPSTSWGLSLDGQWIGPGFVSLGFAQLLNDILDLSASPFVRMLEGKLLLRATVSRRSNNLRKTRIATIERWMTNGGLTWQISDAVSLDVQVGQYTMTSDHQNDTLRADNKTQTLSFTPNWRFQVSGQDHFLIASASIQRTIDGNILSGRYGNNSSLNLTLSHATQFPSRLGINTSLSYSHTETFLQSLRFATLSESLNYPLTERLGLRTTIGINTTTATRTTLQLFFRGTLSYSLEQWGTLTFQLMNNAFDMTTDNRYTELFASLQYTVNL